MEVVQSANEWKGDADGGASAGAAVERAGRVRQAQLTERDVLAISWLVEQRIATLAQVQALLGQLTGRSVTERRARQIVSRWELLGIAERWRVWHGEASLVWPTAQAARLSGMSRWRRAGIGTLRHHVAIDDIRLQAAPVGGPRRWICEAELRRTTPRGVHVADGALIEHDGCALAIEVELTPHGRSRVSQAITSLLAEQRDGRPRWSGVVYVCSRTTAVQVRAVVDALPHDVRTRVAVRDLP